MIKSSFIILRDLLFPELALKRKRKYLAAKFDDSVKFYSGTEILNNSGDSNRIRIGKGSNILGILQVFNNSGEIEVGEYCYVGENTRLISASKILIGSNVQLAHGINIFDNNIHSLNAIERQLEFQTNLNKGLIKLHDLKEKPVIIEDNVWIGANCIILKGVTIGENSIIGAGSIVVKNIPANVVAIGNPIRIVKQLEIIK